MNPIVRIRGDYSLFPGIYLTPPTSPEFGLLDPEQSPGFELHSEKKLEAVSNAIILSVFFQISLQNEIFHFKFK